MSTYTVHCTAVPIIWWRSWMWNESECGCGRHSQVADNVVWATARHWCSTVQYNTSCPRWTATHSSSSSYCSAGLIPYLVPYTTLYSSSSRFLFPPEWLSIIYSKPLYDVIWYYTIRYDTIRYLSVPIWAVRGMIRSDQISCGGTFGPSILSLRGCTYENIFLLLFFFWISINLDWREYYDTKLHYPASHYNR